MNRGAAAEAIAANFLAAHGLLIVQRNYRCRGGKIDLIARDGATLVFAEVRLRRNRGFGTAAESITAAKRRRSRLAAKHYLAQAASMQFCSTRSRRRTSSGCAASRASERGRDGENCYNSRFANGLLLNGARSCPQTGIPTLDTVSCRWTRHAASVAISPTARSSSSPPSTS
jgi:uncharacterized protein (TIGR00252 family)